VITETLHYVYSLNPKWCCAHFGYLFCRIHPRQHASTDDAGMSKHRLSPYNAYHNWLI